MLKVIFNIESQIDSICVRVDIKKNYLHNYWTANNMVHCAIVHTLFDIKGKGFLVWADGSDEFGDVVGVQCAGLSWKTTGKISVADVNNTL